MGMPRIKELHGRKIYNSRGEPTLEVTLVADNNLQTIASIPAGAAAGRYEAKSVSDIPTAIRNVEVVIGPSVLNHEVTDQAGLDKLLIGLDGTKDKSTLGGNCTLGVSLAACKAGALAKNLPLYRYFGELAQVQNFDTIPTPLFNLINGGKHADNNLPFQEFMVVPLKEGRYEDKLEIGRKVFVTLKESLRRMSLSTNVGDEGGFAPTLQSDEAAVEILTEAIQLAGFQPAQDAGIAIDVAAANIPNLSAATYPLEPVQFYEKLANDYPLIALEDPFVEDDWASWKALNQKIGSRVKILGDDLTTSNPERVRLAIEQDAVSGLLITPTQIGTITETLEAVRVAREAKLAITVTHRSGETEDNFIADLGVGIQADFIKAGALNRGERVAKYNQLLRIASELGK